MPRLQSTLFEGRTLLLRSLVELSESSSAPFTKKGSIGTLGVSPWLQTPHPACFQAMGRPVHGEECVPCLLRTKRAGIQSLCEAGKNPAACARPSWHPHAPRGPRSTRPPGCPSFSAQRAALGGQSSWASPERGLGRACPAPRPALLQGDSRRCTWPGLPGFLHTLWMLPSQYEVALEERLGEHLSIQFRPAQPGVTSTWGSPLGDGTGWASRLPPSEQFAPHRWYLIFCEGATFQEMRISRARAKASRRAPHST